MLEGDEAWRIPGIRKKRKTEVGATESIFLLRNPLVLDVEKNSLLFKEGALLTGVAPLDSGIEDLHKHIMRLRLSQRSGGFGLMKEEEGFLANM